MKTAMKVAKIISDILNIISILAVLAMLVLVVADVLLRALFDSPIIGATEIVRMLMICIAPSFVCAVIEDKHIKVGLIMDNLGRKAQIVVDIITLLLTSGICALMSWQAWVYTKYAIKYNEYYSLLKIPKWPFELIFCIALGVTALAILYYLVIRIVKPEVYAPKAPEEGGGVG